MDDLISRAAAVLSAKRAADDWFGNCDLLRDKYIEMSISYIPVADVVSVVRCRDCKYFRLWRHDRGEDSRCEYWNTETAADDFCSQAV